MVARNRRRAQAPAAGKGPRPQTSVTFKCRMRVFRSNGRRDAAVCLARQAGPGTAHVMQFRPIGVESPGEELVPEGADLGEQAGLRDVAAACRGGSEADVMACHDAALLFSLATSAAASAF